MIIHQPHNSADGYAYNTVVYDNIEYEPHFHSNFEVIYIYEGWVDAVIGGKEVSLREGDIALCLSNEIHEYKTVGFSKCWVTVFSADFVPEFKRKVRGKVADTCKISCDAKIFGFLKENFFLPDTEDFFLISSCLTLLCGEYLKSVHLLDKEGKEFSKITQITDYIAQNYKKPITLEQTADALGYERCYFSKLFKNTFGVGFCDYINTLRFGDAARELTHTTKTVTEIGLDAGFQSLRSFNEVFKRKSGMTPKKYRETTRNK